MQQVYLVYNSDTLKYNGFYIEGEHDVIPSPNIPIDNDLWEYLRGITKDFKLIKDFPEKELYNLEDKALFETMPIPFKETSQEPTRIDVIDEQQAQLMLDLVNKDMQIKELEKQQAQALLEGVEKDIEIKNLQKDMADVILQLATHK